MRRPSFVIALALGAVLVITYARPLLGGDTFVSRDHLTHTIPAKTYLGESLADGRVPGWWDGVGMGVPFAANPNHSALYPPAWLTAVLPMPWAIDFLLIAHVLLAGLGTAALSRRLGADSSGSVVAGGVLMTAGFVTSTVVHGGPLLTLAWAPWLAWAADRLAAATGARTRALRAVELAGLYAVQLLAGDPSFAIISGLLALGVVLCRAERRWVSVGALALAALGAALLAAIVLVPALALAGETGRAGGVAADEAGIWSMHPLRLAEWVWPRLLGDPTIPELNAARGVADASAGAPGLGTSWALGAYLGGPVLLLAGAGCGGRGRRRWLVAVAVAFLLLALGRYTPVYPIYRAVVVPEQLVRYPEKHALGALIVVCALAGVGFTRVVMNRPGRRLRIGLALGAAALAAGLIAGLIARLPLRAALAADDLRPPVDADAVVGEARTGALSVLGVLALLALAVVLAQRGRRRWAAPLAAAALVGHMVGQVWALVPVADRDRVTGRPALLDTVADAAGGAVEPRLYRPQSLSIDLPSRSAAARAERRNETAVPNTATRFGFSYLVGYDQARSERLRRLWQAATSAGARVLDLYGVRFAVLPATVAQAAEMPVLAGGGGAALAENPDPRPRAFVAPRWRWFPDDDAVIEELFPPGVGPGHTIRMARVRLTGAGRDAPSGDPVPAPACAVRSPRPERVELHCDSETGGYAVLLEAWSPGWTATVDGEPADLVRADVVARAVRVGAGAHDVVFRYRTPGLGLGALVSVLAWLNLFGLRFVLRSRK